MTQICPYSMRVCEKRGLTYKRISNLAEFETFLADNCAKHFLVDGNFPRTKEGNIEMLAEEGLRMAKDFCPNSNVVLYSSASDVPEIGSKAGVPYLHKHDYVALEVLDKLEKMVV